jgi:nucleotide-binding universal stress UspA family protein
VRFGLANHSDKIEKKIKIFEKAVDTKKLKFETKKIERIFLAIDAHFEASEISENALQITLNLAKRFQAKVYIACIAPTSEELKISEKLVKKALQLLESENIAVTGSCGFGHPSENILELSKQFNPNLIVISTPYGERTETFNIESLGTTVDLIIRKSPYPILLVRKPIFPPTEIMKSILLIIDSIKTIQAAEWALTLAENNSKIMILSITEKETMEKVEELAESLLDSEIDKDIVERLHRWEIRTLINGIISEAETKELKVEKKLLIGDRIKLTLEEAKEKHTVLICATTLEQDNVLENEVENLARLSRIPILIVKI